MCGFSIVRSAPLRYCGGRAALASEVTMSKQFVFVHGMSHGAWCWAAVQARLERAGHATLAVDLPGHGRRAHEGRRASVAAYARAVADAIALAGFSRAIVVGHSMAGVVIPKVAELVPARVAHLVFLAAVVLSDGGTLLAPQIPAPARRPPRGRSGLAPGDPRVVEALTHLTPQPFRPWAERVPMRRFYALAVPRTYIRCLRDARA